MISHYGKEYPGQDIRNGSGGPGCAMAAGVSLLCDLPRSATGASTGDYRPEMDVDTRVSHRVPTAKYTKVGETLRHVIPGHMQCSMACGGRACKYENPSRWSSEEQAVKGLYSSWITDNLLAMARPSTEIIEKYNIIDQFQRCGLRTIINLQRPGEHASCGNPLEQESGFSYRPESFMEAGMSKQLQDIAEDRQVIKDEIVEVPDLTAEVEKTVSQQALQQLGKEMMGKGITGPSQQPPGLQKVSSVPAHDAVLSSDNDLDPLWSRQNAECLNPRPRLRKSLSYSDSNLSRLGAGRRSTLRGAEPFDGVLSKQCLSQENLSDPHQASRSPTPSSPPNLSSPIWEVGRSGSPPFPRRRPLRYCQRSLSLGSSEKSRNPSEREPTSPPIILPEELSLDARRMLVAEALSTDLDLCGEEVKHKVLRWQTELNSREGTWERLCMEKDPRVLAGLMWSWLEQLKEPVITKEDILVLDRNRQAQQPALNSIDKASRETLLCILDCMAHLLTIPEEVEDAFLDRTIKAFTFLKQEVSDSEDEMDVYGALKEILKPVLHEMRKKAFEEPDAQCYCNDLT
ncbi:hypothetical protein GJAV_G00172680 [Gymnothorax javanicus]|nr:hypothetical protein GJAV_G00172680 [Gymnothorax javanicus]